MTPARIRLLTLVATLLTAAGVTAPASAQPCADAIIDDWADNAAIDGTYPLDCYRSAIQALPEDLRAYSSAADDIRRAQQELIAAQSGSGDGDATGGGGGGGSQGDGGGPAETGERDPQGETQAQDTLSGVTEDESVSPSESGESGESGAGSETTAAAVPGEEAFGEELGDGGSTLPMPIIVLLAVAGAAAVSVAGWLIVRQLRARRSGG